MKDVFEEVFGQHTEEGEVRTSPEAIFMQYTLQANHTSFVSDIGWLTELNGTVEIPYYDMPISGMVGGETTLQNSIVKVLNALMDCSQKKAVPKYNLAQFENAVVSEKKDIKSVLHFFIHAFENEWTTFTAKEEDGKVEFNHVENSVSLTLRFYKEAVKL